MRKIITIAAAGITGTLLTLAIPVSAAMRTPTVQYPLEQLGNLRGTVCLSAPPAGGPVSSVLCDAAGKAAWQMFQAAPGPRFITGQGLCLTATARRQVWVMPCGAPGQRWWGPDQGLNSQRFPKLCITGPDGDDESVLGLVRLAGCGEYNTAQVWEWVWPASTVPMSACAQAPSGPHRAVICAPRIN